MMYQRLSGAFVSVVLVRSVITGSLRRRWRGDQVEQADEDAVEDADVQPDHEADRKDQHGQVAHLLAGRPADLPQLGPDLIEIASKSLHSSSSSFLSTATACRVTASPSPAPGQRDCEPSAGGFCGRGDRTRPYTRRFWRPVLCQIELHPCGGRGPGPTSPRGEVYAVALADSI